MSKAWLKLGIGMALVACGTLSLLALRYVNELTEPVLQVDKQLDSYSRATPSAKLADPNVLRFAVATMVSPENTFVTYKALVNWISGEIDRRQAFVVRPSYRDVRHDLEQGLVDVAFVCTGTYLHAARAGKLEILVQPEFVLPLQYCSLWIIPASSTVSELTDLRGAVMGFADPESHTGCLAPKAILAAHGEVSERFFGKTVFTGSHDRSIHAVAGKAIDAAAVSSLVYAAMCRQNQDLAGKLKILFKSQPFGPPPIVVPKALDPALKQRLREAFLRLDQSAAGRAILAGLGIERFILPRPADYVDAFAEFRQIAGRDGAQ